ncbi:hypothetical protein CDAR_537001 [Caerostris darwini]|uniref:Uncharacterized protein n=1 Tax=Caerostris darwini TaxID=1538125 RepID=A0AAV4PM24_9ARAC|nr:hypothetical protein CDAR_537001 [Caerostris darwini]
MGCPKSTCRLERVFRLQTCENRITGNPLISFLILIPDLCSVTIRECTFGMDSLQSSDEGFTGPWGTHSISDGEICDRSEWYGEECPMQLSGTKVFDGYVL